MRPGVTSHSGREGTEPHDNPHAVTIDGIGEGDLKISATDAGQLTRTSGAGEIQLRQESSK